MCSNYSPRNKNGPAPVGGGGGGSQLFIGLYSEKHEKIFLPETIRPRALLCSSRPPPSLFKLCPLD